MTLLLLLAACSSRAVPEPAASPEPVPAPAPVAEAAPAVLPVARACEEVRVDAADAVDLAEVPVAPILPRPIGPPSEHFGFVGDRFLYLDEAGSLHAVGADGEGDTVLAGPGIAYWYATDDAIVTAFEGPGGASWRALPIEGGPARDLEADPRQARLAEERALRQELGLPRAELVRVSDSRAVVTVDRVVSVVDLEAREVVGTLDARAAWPPVGAGDGRAAVVAAGGHELWVVDAEAAEARCVGRSDAEILTLLEPVGEGLAWTASRGSGDGRAWEVHWSDPAAGTDQLLATVAEARMVALRRVPGQERLVVTVRRGQEAAFYDLPREGGARRLGPWLPGPTDPAVGPDGTVMVAIEAKRARSSFPVPPPPEHDGVGTCDPIGCPPGACGDLPDHCGGRIFCGPCPDARTVAGPVSRDGYAVGLYALVPEAGGR